MNNLEDLMMTVRMAIPSLPRAEKAVAESIIENPDAVAHLRTIENYLIYELDVTGPDLYGVKDRLLSEDYFGVIRLRKSPKINEIDKICEINEDGKRIIYLYDKSIEKIRIIKLSFDGDEYYVEVVDRHIDTYLEKCALELANKLDRILNYKD